MARVPLPAETCRLIARKSVVSARNDLFRRGWKSASSLQPLYDDGEVGISTTLTYLLRQNSGFEPFIMWWVKNRTLPLACAQGDGPHFRNGAGVGTPGWVDIPHKGKVYRQVRWKHPGLKPKRFMESSIQRAVKDSREDIRRTVMKSLRGEQ